MFQITKISSALANKISEELNLGNDKKEVIAYGAFAFVQTFIILLFLIVLGLIFDVLVEALILSIATSILRKYSGGVHASSPETCTVLSIIVCMVEAVFIVHFIVPMSNILAVITIVVISFIWAYYYIYKLAPVDSSSKPIRSEVKKKKLKKYSFAIVSGYLIFALSNIVLYSFMGKNSFLNYTLCMCGSIWWQVFTLTQSGHTFVNKFTKVINLF
ncbi:accessory gene regulator B family protein [Clostridium sediminicola]|uniref:accessory gene regulator ArgB-like protein n=1 Tax=Clostridium sediminicola TaxID=3114879 RepID=UPI0031F1F359